MLWYNIKPTFHVTQITQPQSNESYGEAVGRLCIASCCQIQTFLMNSGRSAHYPLQLSTDFKKAEPDTAAKLPGSWWTWRSGSGSIYQHLRPHTRRQVSSGQTLTNLRLDTLSPWNMPVPKQWVTGQGLTLVQLVQRERRGKGSECLWHTCAYTFMMTCTCVKESVSVAHYDPDCSKWHSSVFCSQSDAMLLMDAWHLNPDQIWLVSSHKLCNGSTISHRVLLQKQLGEEIH